jgi:hypothetical protein
VSPQRKRLLHRRPLSYLFTGTLRLRHSWTRWSRTRKERRLAREVRRHQLLVELTAVQETRILRLEQRLHPVLLSSPQPPPRLVEQMLESPPPQPEMEPEPETPASPQPAEPSRPPQPEQMEPLLPEEMPPDPSLEIGRLLGLPPRQTTSPSSGS